MFQGHLATCGSVLEPCPHKCGSYIQRNMITKHLQECVNVAKVSNYQKVVYDSSKSSINDQTINRRGTIQGIVFSIYLICSSENVVLFLIRYLIDTLLQDLFMYAFDTFLKLKFLLQLLHQLYIF